MRTLFVFLILYKEKALMQINKFGQALNKANMLSSSLNCNINLVKKDVDGFEINLRFMFQKTQKTAIYNPNVLQELGILCQHTASETSQCSFVIESPFPSSSGYP